MPRRSGGGGGSAGNVGSFARSLIPKMKQVQAERPGVPLTVDEMATTLKVRFRELHRHQNASLRKAVLEASKVLQREQQRAEQARAKAESRRLSSAESHTAQDDDDGSSQPAKRSRFLTSDASLSATPLSAGTAAPNTTDEERARKKKAPASKSAARQFMDSISMLGDSGSGEKKLFQVVRPSTTFSDLGGIDQALAVVRSKLKALFAGAHLFRHLGFEPPKGLLLHGPPGCGKTLLAHAIAGEWTVPMIKVAAPELIGGTSGDSEKYIRDLFSQAVDVARHDNCGCIVFLDEIDTITSKRENAQREMERRIVAQLISTMDGLSLTNTGGNPVLVVGATTRPDALDPAIRRTGRFDTEVALSVPNLQGRGHILRVLCAEKRVDPGVDFDDLAKRTPGFVGADLMSLANQACLHAVLGALSQEEEAQDGSSDKEQSAPDESTPTVVVHDGDSETMDTDGDRGEGEVVEGVAAAGDTTEQDDSNEAQSVEDTVETITLDDVTEENAAQAMETPQLSALFVTMADFEAALKRVQPSATREGFATTPSVTWDDVGALAHPRRELEEAIKFPLQAPETCASVGINKPPGVLLYGPPGCGKTLLAKALANSCNANFISIKGPELMNKFVGESERAVRQVFSRAKTSSPCVVFFDELDALCPKRGDASSSRVSERIVNQLLVELDGFDSDENKVFVIGATNRIDIIDPAMLRPGRLEKLVYVGLPDASARADIMRTQARQINMGIDVDLAAVAADQRCRRFTGADSAALLREAGTAAIWRLLQEHDQDFDKMATLRPSICRADLDIALGKVKPSVSVKDEERYHRIAREFDLR